MKAKPRGATAKKKAAPAKRPPTATAGKPQTARKRINVALQGGGAHGAFSWGVLDAILADERLEIEAISGTSAGAMSAVVVAEGLAAGGREQAREKLERFWHAVSRQALFGVIQRTPLDILRSNWSLDSNPLFLTWDMAMRVVSPYQLNPLNINPLRRILEEEVDFARVHTCATMQLFISATNVHSGQVRIFTGDEVTLEAVLASACLPELFQAVEIDGEPYWDGGFMGNPVLFPFVKHCHAPDVLIVQVNPIRRAATPTTAREIHNRVSEIAANSSLVHELLRVELVNRGLERGDFKGRGYRPIFLHRVGGGGELAELSASSKLNPEWLFLTHLRDLGRQAATAWLEQSFDRIGRESTLVLDSVNDPKGGPAAAPESPKAKRKRGAKTAAR
ncbi:MAG: patatin-like phospholipase family protein [Hyphomicrobiaceae bacterium]